MEADSIEAQLCDVDVLSSKPRPYEISNRAAVPASLQRDQEYKKGDLCNHCLRGPVYSAARDIQHPGMYTARESLGPGYTGEMLKPDPGILDIGCLQHSVRRLVDCLRSAEDLGPEDDDEAEGRSASHTDTRLARHNSRDSARGAHQLNSALAGYDMARLRQFNLVSSRNQRLDHLRGRTSAQATVQALRTRSNELAFRRDVTRQTISQSSVWVRWPLMAERQPEARITL